MGTFCFGMKAIPVLIALITDGGHHGLKIPQAPPEAIVTSPKGFADLGSRIMSASQDWHMWLYILGPVLGWEDGPMPRTTNHLALSNQSLSQTCMQA